MNQQLRLASVSIGVILTILQFNNCSGSHTEAEVSELVGSSANSNGNSQVGMNRVPANDSSANSNNFPTIGVPNTNSTAAIGTSADTNLTCVGDKPAMKVLTSESLSGPWLENGSVCRGRTTYFKVVGIPKGAAVKGCASPAANDSCLNLSNHRVFTAEEKVGEDIITKILAADFKDWPVGDYAFFITLLGANNANLIKLSQKRFQDCPGTVVPPSTSLRCDWRWLNPRFTVGGGPTAFPPATLCSAAIAGREEFGYFKVYSSDPPTPNDYRYRCECN